MTSLSDDKTSLDAKDKEWRKACAAAIGLGHDQVGTFLHTKQLALYDSVNICRDLAVSPSYS